MKRTLITIATILTLVASAWAKPDHLETGKYTTTSGKTIVITYVVDHGQCTDAYLILPDGQTVRVSIEPGTTMRTVDDGLIKLMENL